MIGRNAALDEEVEGRYDTVQHHSQWGETFTPSRLVDRWQRIFKLEIGYYKLTVLNQVAVILSNGVVGLCSGIHMHY